MTTTTAIYEKGVRKGILRLNDRLQIRNHEVVILRFERKPDPIDGTRGIIHASPRFARELTKPHRYSGLDR